MLGRPFSLTTGVDYEVADDHRRGYENFIGATLGTVGALRRDEHNRVSMRDVYVQAIWQPVERWRINVGARHSRVRFEADDFYINADNPDDSGQLEYSRTSPVVGVLLRVAPEISVYTNAGAGFATPTFAELAYRSDARSGLNDSLRPARSRNYEIGVRAIHEALEYSAAAFQSRTEDELVVSSNQHGRSVYDNAGVTRRRGLEFALSAKFTPHWHVATAYTYLDARYASDFVVCATPPCAQDNILIKAGSRIPGLARHVAWAELRFSAAEHTDFMLDGRFDLAPRFGYLNGDSRLVCTRARTLRRRCNVFEVSKMERRLFLRAATAMAAVPLGLAQACVAAEDEISPEAEVLRANWREFVPEGADLPSAADKLLDVSKATWRERLPEARFLVMFEDETEPAWSSKLLEIEEPGVFICAACRLPLFTTPMKFHSGTGWPSFYTFIPGNLETQLDFSLIWPRTEYHCVRCGSHQGHLFDNWPTPTGLRYCNNGLALQFLPRDGSEV